MLTCSRDSVPEGGSRAESVGQHTPLVTASGKPGLSSLPLHTRPNVPARPQDWLPSVSFALPALFITAGVVVGTSSYRRVVWKSLFSHSEGFRIACSQAALVRFTDTSCGYAILIRFYRSWTDGSSVSWLWLCRRRWAMIAESVRYTRRRRRRLPSCRLANYTG